jgi:hypothetical protein
MALKISHVLPSGELTTGRDAWRRPSAVSAVMVPTPTLIDGQPCFTACLCQPAVGPPARRATYRGVSAAFVILLGVSRSRRRS